MWICLLVAFAIGGAALAQTPSPNEKKTISITWLGHAAFEIVSPGGTHLLIDPFLTKNPATPAENKDLARYHPSHILVTHSHGDHLGDAVELAKLSKAKLVSVMMLDTFVTKGGLPREQIETVNVGDQVTAGDVKIHVVPACTAANQADVRSVTCSSSAMGERYTMKAIPGSLATCH